MKFKILHIPTNTYTTNLISEADKYSHIYYLGFYQAFSYLKARHTVPEIFDGIPEEYKNKQYFLVGDKIYIDSPSEELFIDKDCNVVYIEVDYDYYYEMIPAGPDYRVEFINDLEN